MATYYSQATDDWSTLVNWDTNAGGGGSNPASVADMDDDTFIIQASHIITLDVDMSGFANGIAGLEIKGGATPGMLVCESGGNGTYHLMIKTGTHITGTTDTNKGRILANSDEAWGNTGVLPFGRKFIIDLKGTAQIKATNLNIALYCDEPATKGVRTYKTKKTVTGSASADTLTNVGHGWANGTVLSFQVSGGTLPAPLLINTVYYVVNTAANTFKVAYYSSGSTIDLTTDGSGTIEAYDGHTNTGTATMNVLDDVTSEAEWITTNGHNAVVLVDCYAPSSYDQQRLQLATINAGSIVLSANVDSAQYPGATIWLSSRNISIRSSGTLSTQTIILYDSGDIHGGVFDCEIKNTTGTGLTFRGYGIRYGSGHIISGIITGCSIGVDYGSGHIISGTITGCNRGVDYGSGNIISGIISGCSTGTYYGSGNTISGIMTGCSTGVSYGSGNIISGIISGCNRGVDYGSGNIISGIISGCNTGTYYGSGNTISGIMTGCNTSIHFGSGHIISGTVNRCSVSFNFPVGNIVVYPGAEIDYSFSLRNTLGYHSRIAIEEYAGVPNAYKIHDNAGDIIKTACDGTGDAPSIDPDGGNGYCHEASNIQSNCGLINKLVIFSKHRIWLAATTYTVTYKVQTTYTEITAGNLKLTCNYIGAAGAIIEIINAPAINQRSGDTDWTQTLAVTFTTTLAGWTDFKIELMEYESGNEVYVWPTPVVS